MNRKKIVAGNWKMNTNPAEGSALVKILIENFNLRDPQMIVIPPFIHLAEIEAQTRGTAIEVGAQNCHQEGKGAYTGEIAAPMLAALNIKYVILGHSERRQYFGETDQLLAQKVNAALAAGLSPIFCVGEPLAIREKGQQNQFVSEQLLNGLYHLPAESLAKLIIAYEPIWAIGTGVTASPTQAQDMHAFIRGQLSLQYGQSIADQLSILYGGSVKGSNAREIFAQADVDGALVGGASLDALDFLKIANSF
jgi:triosephosphate isomerase (TIM)